MTSRDLALVPAGGSSQRNISHRGASFSGFTSMDDFASMSFDQARDSLAVSAQHDSLVQSASMGFSRMDALGFHPMLSGLSGGRQRHHYGELVDVPKRGVSERALRRFPVKRAARGETEKCSVCLEVYEHGSSIMTLPCSHSFHEKCIRHWFVSNRQCPMCRFEVEE